jgi:hypothetical protein
MTLTHATLNWHDNSYPNNAAYGPINVPVGAYVTRARMTGHVTAQTQVLSYSGFPGNLKYYQGLVGIERVQGGTSPINIEGSGSASTQFIATKGLEYQTGSFVAIPSSAPNGMDVFMAYPVDVEWAGLYEVTTTGGQDFYGAIGRMTSGEPTFLFAAHLSIWYDS